MGLRMQLLLFPLLLRLLLVEIDGAHGGQDVDILDVVGDVLGGVLDDVEDVMDDARGIKRLLGMREVTEEVLRPVPQSPNPGR